MPSISGRVSKPPTLLVPHDPEAKQKTRRAVQTFGVRELKTTEFSKYGLENQRKILKEQRSAPVVKVRVGNDETLRQGLLPLYKGWYGGNDPSGKKSIGRFLQRFFAWFSWNRRTSGSDVKLSVLGPYAQTLRESRNPQRPVNNGWGNTEMQSRGSQQTIQAPDTDLARLIGYEGKWKFSQAYAVVDRKLGTDKHDGDSLFGGKAPQLSDIRQSDKRQTCHFLSNLAAILARPDGAQRIQNIMKDNGDGTVTVRFADMDVRVTKDRLVNGDGDDLFNVGAPWVRVMEKAFLGYLAHQFGNTTDLSTIESKQFRGKDNLMFRFDVNQPSIAQMALGHTLAQHPSECSTIDEEGKTTVEFKQNGFRPEKTGLLQLKPDTGGRTPDEIYEQVERTLQDGGSVFAGVTAHTNWFRRMLSGHIYSIVATGERTKVDSEGNPELDSNGKPKVEKGFWVFDPYGTSVDSDDIEKSKNEGTDVSVEGEDQRVVLKDGTRGRNSRFFVTAEQAAELFSDFNIAHRVQPPEQSENSEINPPESQRDGSNSVSNEVSDFEQIERSQHSTSPDVPVTVDENSEVKSHSELKAENLVHEFFGMTADEVKDLLAETISSSTDLELTRNNFQISLDPFTLGMPKRGLTCRIVDVPGVQDVQVDFNSNGLVELEYAKLTDATQGQGLAKGFFQAILKLADRAPQAVKKMEMIANISVGGYAWARAGFVPSTPEQTKQIYEHALPKLKAYLRLHPSDQQVEKLRRELEEDIRSGGKNPRLIRKIAALSKIVPFDGDFAIRRRKPKEMKGDYTLGKACLLGTEWEGTFDLKQDRKYLESYIRMNNAPKINPFGNTRSDFREQYDQMTWGNSDTTD